MFNEKVGPYPYEKLALIIGATQFGGMENSSAIVFPSTFFNPNPSQALSKTFDIRTGIEDVVAHEIAHQWFGDSVTESTWADLWLSEGFATYFSGLFIEKHEGEEAFQQYLKRAADTAFDYEQKNRIPIHDLDTQDLFKLLNGNNYQKGAWVLHMLRSRLGDEAFFQGIRSTRIPSLVVRICVSRWRKLQEKIFRHSLRGGFTTVVILNTMFSGVGKLIQSAWTSWLHRNNLVPFSSMKFHWQ